MSSSPCVDIALTRKLADLARLELSSEEEAALTEQLSQILSYFEKLQEVDVQGVEPCITPVEIPTRLRDDELQNFSWGSQQAEQGAYKVPAIL